MNSWGIELPNQLVGVQETTPLQFFFNIMINEFAHITYLIILYLRFCFLKNTMVIEKLFIYLFISGLLLHSVNVEIIWISFKPY